MIPDMIPENAHNQYIGKIGEDAAAACMQAKGMEILIRNFKMLCGEIDIVAMDGGVLVFCEVKTRDNPNFGPPECAVNNAKQHQIRRAAEGYLTVHELYDQECRFDVAAVQLVGMKPEITYFENAFFF